MTVKVLVNELGAHIVADVKQVENKETKEVLAYWMKNPRIISYSRGEDGNVNVSFNPFCLVSDEQEFSIRANHIVSILEPRDDVKESWEAAVYPAEDEVEAAETEVVEVPDAVEPVAS